MHVLSLFDGMSCGRLALTRANINVTSYCASEIDKYAITISNKNYPDIIQLGDIKNWKQWKIPQPDLIMGGSPCQGFSLAGKQLAFDDPRSKLFFDFVNIINHYKPKYFLLENVRMKKEHTDVITKYLGVQPICINSSLVSAQNRVRYYWCNWDVTQPDDKNILLKDILQDDSNYSCRMTGRKINEHGKRDDYNSNLKSYQYIEPRFDGKSNCLTTVKKDSLVFMGNAKINAFRQRKAVYSKEGKSPALLAATGSNHNVKVAINNQQYRHLSPIECERLQTIPDNYTESVSNTQRYKMLGNGWTIDVIAHLLRSI